MTTPNTQIALSDVNSELMYPANTYIKFDAPIVRALTGTRTTPKSPIAMSNLQGKSAFAGLSSNLSVSSSGFGNVSTDVFVTVQTDIANPEIVWSYIIQSSNGNPSVSLTPTQDPKVAKISASSNIFGVKTATIVLSANVGFNGQQFGTKDRTINFTTTVNNTAFTVTGTTTVNATAVTPQTATTTLTASSNVGGGSIVFNVTPTLGTLIQGNTVSFTRTATIVGQDNVASYSLVSKLFSNTGILLSEDNKIVTLRANYISPDLNLTVPSTSNNVFANSGPVNASLQFTSSHATIGANVVWTSTTLSGANATLTVSADKATANLHLPVAGFGTSKSVTKVTATLQNANGMFLNSKEYSVTLRTAGYGLSFTPTSDVIISSYSAETVSTEAQASWQAGTFSWDISRVSGSSATQSASIFTSTAISGISLTSIAPGTLTSTYRVNPVLKFDGIVMANVASQSTLSVTQLPYSFSVDVPTSNTMIGEGSVNASLNATATHDLPGGYVVWTKDNVAVSMTSTTSSASLSISTSTVKSEIVVLTGTLFDSLDRQVKVIQKILELNAYVPDLSFSGNVNVETPPGYSSPQTATGTFLVNLGNSAASAVFTANAEKVSGATLSAGTVGGTSIQKTVPVSAVASTVGSVSGTYRARGVVTWKGVTFTRYSSSATITSTLLPGTISISQSAADNSSGFIAPITATATINVDINNVTGSTVRWNVPAGVTIVSQNNNTLVIRISQSSFGELAANIPITASAMLGGSAVVTSDAVYANPRATLKSANLQLTGSRYDTAAAMFDATASVTLTAVVNPELSGHTFTFTTNAPGNVFSSSGNSGTFTLTKSGSGTATGLYYFSCYLYLSGVLIAQETATIDLTATALVPEIFFGGTNDVKRSYETPTSAITTVQGYTSPPSAATTWEVISGSGGSTSSNGTSFVINASASSVGVVNATRTIKATFRTPSGAIIATRQATFTATAERKDPGFSFSSSNDSIIAKGWGGSVTGSVAFNATVSAELASLGRHSYDVATISAGGASVSTTGGVTTVSRTSSSSSTSATDVRCRLYFDGQLIAEQTKRATITISPYYFYLSPSTVNDTRIEENSGSASGTFYCTSNHEDFASSVVSWNVTQSPVATGFSSSYVPEPYNLNHGLNVSLTPKYAQPNFASGSVVAYFTANGSSRSSDTGAYSLSTGPLRACVCLDMWMDEYTQAIDAKVGMEFMTWTPETGYDMRPIGSIAAPVLQSCVQLTSATGAVLRCSATTPFAIQTSNDDLETSVNACDMQGHFAMVDQVGYIFWDEIVEVINIGDQLTIPIYFGGRNFAAGEHKNARIYSHNAKAE